MADLTIAEQLLYTTLKISTSWQGQFTGSGTGFFYGIDFDEDKSSILLVTNKHVLRGSDRADVVVHVNVSGGVEELVTASIHFNFDELIKHPDPDIDLCALSVNDLASRLNQSGKKMKFVSLRRADIPTAEEWNFLDAIEEVTMVGCPRGIYDEVNNFPIVRRGVTSSNPSKRYNGRPEFLVDIACFPGSSGSPVFLYNTMGYLDRAKNTNVMGSVRLKLLGILYAGPVIAANGQIILATPQLQVNTMMHLGNAIRSSEILKLEEQVLELSRLAASS